MGGQIDLLSLTKAEQFKALTGSAFFVVQHFFYKAIPKLRTPAPPLMEAVQALVAKGGDDLAANFPNEAFRNWCAANPAQAQDIVSAAEAGDQTAIAFVTFALTALGETPRASKRSTCLPSNLAISPVKNGTEHLRK